MVSGIFTVVLLVTFLGIVAWAFSRKRRQSFDEAAQLPLENDEPLPPKNDDNERRDGDGDEGGRS
ncbi:cbb3-type cytochrome oxidase subunit 3 [Spiribacter onubensis]|uniref:Cbb3-type cytochrome c oxidase subunit 3 n=1 Tax=Spiribacter onubensis TaxID=3122420 RepID=A0ABV3SDD1_9GAMM